MRFRRFCWVFGGVMLACVTAGCSGGDVPGVSGCLTNAECPDGQYCGPSSVCTFDCKRDEDCPGGTCNSLGKCVTGTTPRPDTGPVSPDGGPVPPPDQGPDITPPPPDMAIFDVPRPPDSTVDGPRDSTVDGAMADSTVDGATADSTVDGAAADSTIDAPVPDSTVDAPLPDSTVDAPLPDSTVDAPLPDTLPPWDVTDCGNPQPLVLVNGLATATGDTTGASSSLALAKEGCTGFTTPGPDHFYSVNLVGGKLYEVTLTPAGSFDPTLYVVTSCDAATCQPGMGTDRLGNGVAERVLLAPELSRAYLLVVDSYSAAEAGSYTLTIKEFSPPLSNNTCAVAETLSFSQGLASAAGNTSGATSDVDLPKSGCTASNSPGPDLFYSVYLVAGQRYAIQLRPASDFDPALAVFTSCGDIAGTCQPGTGSDRYGNGVVETIELTPKASGLRYILVDSYSPSEKGSFLLLVAQLTGAPSNDDCAQARHLTLQGGKARAIGDTASATNKVSLSSAGCTGFATAGKDLFYTFDAQAGEQYRVTLEPEASFDGALYVFSSCSDPEGTCGAGLGSDNVGAGVDEEVNLQILSGGRVRIGVDSYGGTAAGTFALTVQQTAVQTCGPANCSGCCANNTCYVGTQEQACGAGGAQCKSCGTGLTCGAGQCVLDDEAFFRVVLVSGTVPAKDSSGDNWDNAGAYVLPDPYVRIAVGSLSQYSGYVNDTLSPVWNQALLDAKAGEIKTSLSLQVWDADPIGDDLMTSCAPLVSEAEIVAGSKMVSCGSATLLLQFFVR